MMVSCSSPRSAAAPVATGMPSSRRLREEEEQDVGEGEGDARLQSTPPWEWPWQWLWLVCCCCCWESPPWSSFSLPLQPRSRREGEAEGEDDRRPPVGLLLRRVAAAAAPSAPMGCIIVVGAGAGDSTRVIWLLSVMRPRVWTCA